MNWQGFLALCFWGSAAVIALLEVVACYWRPRE